MYLFQKTMLFLIKEVHQEKKKDIESRKQVYYIRGWGSEIPRMIFLFIFSEGESRSQVTDVKQACGTIMQSE